MIPENALSSDQLASLVKEGTVIGNKGDLPAVILSPDETIYKFWIKRPRLGKLFKFRSYARRFIKASALLNQSGFSAPDIISYHTINNRSGEIVRYHHLPGDSIRDLLESSPEDINIDHLARIFFDLHEAGFRIRTLHFGNVLQDQGGTMRLIDCSNVQKFSGPLSLAHRAKNLAVPLRYAGDAKRYQDAGLPDFVEAYFKAGRFTSDEETQIRTLVKQRLSSS